ncbi:hypothetical protein BV20DRAFT_857997 [Pilatotrama ljubarskyi]|nr:hypothetical protein BV20DRAFT_857997 [Pilatotrama ljubarskyi]
MHSVPRLLTFLAPFQQLRRLELDKFSPQMEGFMNPPWFPTMRTLRMHSVSTAAVMLVDFCPNLCALDLRLDREKVSCYPSKDGNTWESLTSSELGWAWEVYLIRNRLKTIDRLVLTEALEQVDCPVPPREHSLTIAFFELLEITSP